MARNQGQMLTTEDIRARLEDHQEYLRNIMDWKLQDHIIEFGIDDAILRIIDAEKEHWEHLKRLFPGMFTLNTRRDTSSLTLHIIFGFLSS